MMAELMLIVVDTREQAPYRFEGYGSTTQTATLGAGDYSLAGFEDRVAIERKALDDLVACLMGSNRERFERELQRLSRYDLGAVVIEATIEDLRQGRYRSQMNSVSALQSVFAFMVRYRVPFIWAGDRAGGELVTFSLLQKYAREITERCRQLARSTPATRQRGDATPPT